MKAVNTRVLMLFFVLSFCLSACGIQPQSTTTPTSLPTSRPTSTAVLTPTAISGSFESGNYRNLFKEYLKKSDLEVQDKLDAAWKQLFYGSKDTQRIYYPVGTDMAYIEDIGNSDVRSEGISYGMMIAVQMDKKEEFNRLWKWAKTYMYHPDGPYKGYFAWHCSPQGIQLDLGPAPDGEEWFTMALFFASARWGDGTGIFNYRKEAENILHVMVHKKDENKDYIASMFDMGQKMIVFVPEGSGATYTDPSYHLPAYYELWARQASEDKDFWKDASKTSRTFFKKAANPKTGLMPDYANFDGTAYDENDHKDFRFDAWRTLSNVAVDYAWFKQDPWEIEQSNRVLDFLSSQGMETYVNQYSLDGKPLSGDHSTGLVSMAAVAALAAEPEKGKPFVNALWDTEIPTGQWRYYDGMLYFLALLHVSGHFQIY
jgi:oligosaccharide reducing-end xylanase